MSWVLAISWVLSIAAIGAVVWWGRGTWIGRQTARRVLVHTVDDKSIEGTLTTSGRDGLVLLAARYLDAETDLSGDVYVPRDQVSFIQFIRSEDR